MKPMPPLMTRAGMLLALLLLATPAAWSQETPPPGGRGTGANAPILTPAELERWFDSYVLLQAQDTLKLSDAQFARLLPPLKALQGVRRRHAQARRQTLVALGGLVKANPVDEAALRDRLKGLRELELKSRDEIQRAYDAIDEVLDPTQQARFRLFEEQVERRKIDLLMKARQRAGERAGGNRGR
jgi:Spy/CpxP family protein refolding chaperone